METLFAPIFVVVATVIVSTIVHEYGHAWAAKKLGWKLHGFKFRWYGAGYAVEAPNDNPREFRYAILGGLGATAMLVVLGVLLSYWTEYGMLLATFNVVLLVTQFLPIPNLDGWRLVKGRP